MRLASEGDRSLLRSVDTKKSLISIRIISISSQDKFCNDMRLDAEVDRSIISSIATKEATNIDDIYSLSSSDDTRLLGGIRIYFNNKTKFKKVNDVIMNCGSPSSQIVMLKHILKLHVLSKTYTLLFKIL